MFNGEFDPGEGILLLYSEKIPPLSNKAFNVDTARNTYTHFNFHLSQIK